VQDGWSEQSLCAVGDDDQAMYGWRGAEVRNILRFETHFPGATIIWLEQNYRSTGRIFDCANAVIARSAERRPKRLWTDAGPGDPARVVHLPDEEEEARFIAAQVPDIPRGAHKTMVELAATLERFRSRFGARRLAEGARAMVEDLGLRDWVRQSVLPAEVGARKVDAVDAVLRSLDAHERRDPKATLRTFLQRLALDSRDEEPEDAEGVALMTIHAAKGLEFPVVFIIGFGRASCRFRHPGRGSGPGGGTLPRLRGNHVSSRVALGHESCGQDEARTAGAEDTQSIPRGLSRRGPRPARPGVWRLRRGGLRSLHRGAPRPARPAWRGRLTPVVRHREAVVRHRGGYRGAGGHRGLYRRLTH